MVSYGRSSPDPGQNQKGEMHSALPALTPQPEKEASAWGGGRTLHVCKNCKGAKVTCVERRWGWLEPVPAPLTTILTLTLALKKNFSPRVSEHRS